MDDNQILNQCNLENWDEMYFYFSFSIFSAYFGGFFHELNYEDYWITNGISSVFAENFMTEKCGTLNTWFKKYKYLKWYWDQMLLGKDVLPLASKLWPNPAEIKRNEVYFVKSRLVMSNIVHMVGTENFIKFIWRLLEYISNSNECISISIFKLFKKVLGIKLH